MRGAADAGAGPPRAALSLSQPACPRGDVGGERACQRKTLLRSFWKIFNNDVVALVCSLLVIFTLQPQPAPCCLFAVLYCVI